MTFMAKMWNRLSLFNTARIAVTFVCLICFALQSQREIKKFLSNMTSVSIRYMSGKEANIRLPRFAICADVPFKSVKFPETVEEYLELTYSQNELISDYQIDGQSIELDNVNVTEVATMYYGRCYIVENPHPVVIVGLNITSPANLYFIDHGQELCIINSVQYCDVAIQSVVLKHFLHDIKVGAEKMVKDERWV